MDRLTERFDNGQAAVYGCGNNCKYDFKYCHNAYEDCPTINEIYEKLATFEDLEEQGKLLKLRFKIGDKAYMICGNEVIPFKIYSLKIYENCIYVIVKYSGNNEDLKFWEVRILEKDIKNRLFFTKEAAERQMNETIRKEVDKRK